MNLLDYKLGCQAASGNRLDFITLESGKGVVIVMETLESDSRIYCSWEDMIALKEWLSFRLAQADIKRQYLSHPQDTKEGQP